MRLLLIGLDGKRTEGELPQPSVKFATFDIACPLCGEAPLKARGTGRRIASDDRAYEAETLSLCCDRYVGYMRVETDTFFGIHEDEAIGQRARVYR